MTATPTITLPAANPLTAFIAPDLWTLGIGMGVAVGLFTLIHTLFKEWTWVKILVLYLLLHAWFFASAPLQFFGVFSTAFQNQAAQVVIQILCVFFLVVLKGTQIQKLCEFLGLGAALNVWFGWKGFMIAPSFNLAFAAATYLYQPWWVQLFIIGTVASHHGSTASMILCIHLFMDAVLLIQNSRAKLSKENAKEVTLFVLLFSILAIGGVAIAAHYHSGPLFDGGERLAVYKKAFQLWTQNPMVMIFGVGSGSFMWVSAIQNEFKSGYFLQMHSDWLQILWETGIVGFSLSVVVLISAMRGVWKYPKYFGLLLGGAAFMLTYHPWRFFPSALLMAEILFSCRLVSYRARPNPPPHPLSH